MLGNDKEIHTHAHTHAHTRMDTHIHTTHTLSHAHMHALIIIIIASSPGHSHVFNVTGDKAKTYTVYTPVQKVCIAYKDNPLKVDIHAYTS